ncbi:hypothetical protein BP6252_04046 [Coleophoma cylindrospora]|uniref:Uncharacterized protein n=1 Tax=Coleophoma cylindrospora TaxID=1849047 RepID=A0A3D8RZG8_9HELO|nr:hypothetical protein BP6252_04046 [Coleophoma cylindrospora]
MAAPFVRPVQAGSAWFFAGLTSSFPDVSSQDGSLSDLYQCNDDLKPGCRAFQVAREDSSQAVAVELEDAVRNVNLKDQVLVFQHKGKFHAIDHVRISLN